MITRLSEIGTLCMALLLVASNVFPSDYSFDLVGEGTESGYINPMWAPNSQFFTVQTIDAENDQSAQLYVFAVSNNIIRSKKVYPEGANTGRRLPRRELYPPIETTLSWRSKGEQMFLLSGKSKIVNGTTSNMKLNYSPVNPDLNIVQNPAGKIKGISEALLPVSTPKFDQIFFTSRISNRRSLDRLDSKDPFQVNRGVAKFNQPIQSISYDGDNELLIITGEETEYSWRILKIKQENNLEIEQRAKLDLNIDGRTIYGEGAFSPNNTRWISTISSDSDNRDKDRAFVGVYDLEDESYILQYPIFRHKQKSALMRHQAYHQWHPLRNQVFYMKKNEHDQEQLFYCDIESGQEFFSGLSEDNLQSFRISPDGKLMIILTNDTKRNLKVYRIIE